MVGVDGEQIGVVPIEKAREMAQAAQVDLVEVAPQADPPVCKIMDYSRLIYEQKRRAKDSRKKTRHQELKELKLRPGTDDHDFQTKLNHARDFLEKGHKVKFTVMYRGREMAYFDRGTAILKRAAEELGPLAEVEMTPSARGKTQSMIVAPAKKKPAGEKHPAPEE